MTARHMLRPAWKQMIRGIGAKIPLFAFQESALTFTPYMAKRATGIFATSPIVQGKWDGSGTPDSMSLVRGDQFGNPTDLAYATLDPYQGTLVLWWTPEKSRDITQTADEYLFAMGSVYARYEHDTGLLKFGAPTTHSTALNIVAGITYCLVFRWDVAETIDGTNHICISLNNTHSFGHSTPLTPVVPDATMFVGSLSTALGPTNALIEGLTIYRRPLFDGAYGAINPFDASGPVDEIAAIYAAGAGKDPCLITGSWDVTFCLPTNASAGVLQTGTGQAWSHPHGSNILDHWTLEDGLYGGGQWAVAFNGTTTNINCGSAAALDDLAAGAFTAEAWVRFDSYGEGNFGRMLSKGSGGGWTIYNFLGYALRFLIYGATADSNAFYSYTPDGKYHHVAGTYDNGGDRKARLWVDGILVATAAGAVGGAIVTDAAYSFYIGAHDAGIFSWDGAIGWVRLSNIRRYTADFIPPREFPGADGNTVEAWSLNDGSGSTVVAQVTSPGNDGTAANHTWEQQWDDIGTPPYPTSLEFDGAVTVIDCGSGATLDDLPNGAILTVDGWFRNTKGSSGEQVIINKTAWGSEGWEIEVLANGHLYARIELATTDATAIYTVTARDSRWHHFVAYYDDATKRARIASDGVWGALGAAGVGAHQLDAARNLIIGRISSAAAFFFDGAISWLRLSDNDRYGGATGVNFVPPDRVNPPGADGNTVEQWNLQDGAGLTALAVVTTPGNNGTITMGTGRWWNTPDMESESPGSRVYNWGEAIGSDGANDGIHQHKAGLAAGENYVARVPVRYEADGRAQPRIRVYDETNGATIVDFDGPWLTGQHDGGDNQSALADSSAPYWPYSLVAGVVWNITKGESATITAAGNSIVGTLSGGADWDNNDVYFIIPVAGWVWADTFTLELPTIARNGAAADCTEISFQLLNSAGEGVIYWNQVELLENLVDNPSLETGVLVPPWIPDGWTNNGLDPGDSVSSAGAGGVIHSGVDCIEFAVGAAGEGIWQQITLAQNKFIGTGVWGHSDGTSFVSWYSNSGNSLTLQATLANLFGSTQGQFWEHVPAVARCVAPNPWLYIRALSGAAGARYADDAYGVLCDDVSLTVTPASELNSAETSGLRVDGSDSCTQTQYGGKNLSTILAKKKWRIKWKVTPRHNAADVTKFGTSSPDVAWFYGDADDYIWVDWSAASILRLTFQANGGGEQNGLWVAAVMNAGTTYTLMLQGDGDEMKLYVDGVPRITITQPCVFGTPPATAYWGYHYAGGLHYDATFAAP